MNEMNEFVSLQYGKYEVNKHI